MLQVQGPVMPSTSYTSDHTYGSLDRRVSTDSSTSYLTVSSVASSTLAQPRSIVSYIGLHADTDSSVHTPDTSLYDENADPPNTILFKVLCMHDYNTDEPDRIPFKKNDILTVIYKEPSGWWAAQVEETVGWIPSAFVVEIPRHMVDVLLSVRHELRSIEYEAETLYTTAPTSNFPVDDTPLEDPDIPEHEVDDVQVVMSRSRSPRDFPTDVTPNVSRFDLPREVDPVRSPSPGQFDDRWLHRHAPSAAVPMTPRTPLPPKDPAPKPLYTLREQSHSTSLKVDTATTFNKNKPTPPTPKSNTPLTPPSKPVSFTPPTFLPARSRSLGSGSFSSSNAGRRRPEDIVISTPALLDANLPTLFENPPDYNQLDHEPEVTSSRGQKRGWRPPKVWRITGDDDAQAFHNAQVAQASQPWYLRPQYTGDEIKMEYDGSVTAGTLEALVERLTVEPLKLGLEKAFRHTFLMTFRTFTTADRVLELLIERYEMEAPEGLAHDDFMEWKEKKLRTTQARVLHVFNVWVDEYGLMEDDPHIVPRLRDFLDLVRCPGAIAASAKNVISMLDRPRDPNINRLLFTTSAPTRRNTRRSRNDLLKMDPAELARQLTLYEGRLYVKIRPHECLAWGHTQKGDAVQNLRTFVSTSDKVAAWVKMSVLSNDALGKRADAIELWIKVADKCRMLNNYSSLSAIVAALKSQVIARLQLTWAHVNRASHLDPLMKLSEPTNNFATYRQLSSTTDGPCIPFIGIFLSDMVKVAETLPNKVPASESRPDLQLINFTKRQKKVDVVHSILRHQPQVREQYKISEITQTMRFVEAQLEAAASKDEGGFWSRSQEVQTAELAHADIRKGLEAAGF